MGRIIFLVGLLAAALMPWRAQAEPADIEAASRGVVRVVMIEVDGGGYYYAGHGTGFAVTDKLIVTNAHVVRRMLNNPRLGIGIIPSEGDDPAAGRLIDYDAARDLALIEISGDLRLPALSLTNVLGGSNAEVVAIGYPGVVDNAQGLVANDMVRSLAPITSRGFLAGKRSMPGFDALTHTVSIAGGNSGGPLVDNCGRVLGVNTSGTLSSTGEAEFFFAIAMNELTSFLRSNGVKVTISDMPCRSLAEIEQEERERETAEREKAEAAQAARDKEQAEREASLRNTIASEVQEERENAMAIAALLLLLAAGATAMAAQARGREDGRNRAIAFGAVAGIATIGALYLWFSRPGNDEVEERFREETAKTANSDDRLADEQAGPIGEGALVCTLDRERSRATGKPPEAIPFDWEEGGCVNDRTQYGLANGEWTRVFVPNNEDVVSINSFDPGERIYQVERYLIGRNAMGEAREARQAYSPPSCDAAEAATKLGDMQGSVTKLLPEQPNERLVYECEPRS